MFPDRSPRLHRPGRDHGHLSVGRGYFTSGAIRPAQREASVKSGEADASPHARPGEVGREGAGEGGDLAPVACFPGREAGRGVSGPATDTSPGKWPLRAFERGLSLATLRPATGYAMCRPASGKADP